MAWPLCYQPHALLFYVTAGPLVFDFRSVTSQLMSDEVLGVVAANIGIKDLVHAAVCVVSTLNVMHHTTSAEVTY